jgi:hypothetical protein
MFERLQLRARLLLERAVQGECHLVGDGRQGVGVLEADDRPADPREPDTVVPAGGRLVLERCQDEIAVLGVAQVELVVLVVLLLAGVRAGEGATAEPEATGRGAGDCRVPWRRRTAPSCGG